MQNDPLATPGHPFTPRQIRILKISVALMSVMILIGLLALIYGMARQASRIGRDAPAIAASGEPYVRSLALGPGEVKAVFGDRHLVIIHWKGTSTDYILTIDPATGKELGRIQLAPK